GHDRASHGLPRARCRVGDTTPAGSSRSGVATSRRRPSDGSSVESPRGPGTPTAHGTGFAIGAGAPPSCPTGPSWKEEPMVFRWKCTPDRSKLIGSHGKRPWV